MTLYGGLWDQFIVVGRFFFFFLASMPACVNGIDGFLELPPSHKCQTINLIKEELQVERD